MKASLWKLFQTTVFPEPSTETLFNQYHDTNLSVDRITAPFIRQHNLEKYLHSLSDNPTTLVIGEAPGPWGCRFSGVPFTSEQQLCTHRLPLQGQQSSNTDTAYTSRSSQVFWNTMLQYHPHFLVWNAIPYHPHHHNNHLSVRNPTKTEIAAHQKQLIAVYVLVQPTLVIAIGRTAEYALNRAGIANHYVRHPSYGGATQFTKGITRPLSSQVAS